MAYVRRRRGGVIRASLAAGPLFLLSTTLVAWMQAPAEVVDMEAGMIVVAPYALLLSVIPGFVLALPVNLAGSAVMLRIARDGIGLRHPAVWAIVGGAMAAIPAGVADAGPEGTAIGAFTGALCALICRSGARWD